MESDIWVTMHCPHCGESGDYFAQEADDIKPRQCPLCTHQMKLRAKDNAVPMLELLFDIRNALAQSARSRE